MKLRTAALTLALGLAPLAVVAPPPAYAAGPWDEIDVRNAAISQTHIYMTNGGNSYRLDPGEDWFLYVEGTLIKFPSSAGSWKLGYPGKGYPGACKTHTWMSLNNRTWNPPNVEAAYVIRTWTGGNC